MTTATWITFSSIKVAFGDNIVLDNISGEIPAGKIVSIVGPSWSWKTTLLNVLNGLLPPDNGTIHIDGKSITDVAENAWVVFQTYSLFPWLSIYKNIAFGKNIQALSKSEQKEKIDQILKQIWLWDERSKFPHELSGWMRQRVSIARTIANGDDYIFMDEPFGALDYQTRLRMHEFVLKVWKEFKKTIVIITHNIDEAIYISDKVILLPLQNDSDVEEINIKMKRPRDNSDPRAQKYKDQILAYLEKEVTF